jgi:hypothetical protein
MSARTLLFAQTWRWRLAARQLARTIRALPIREGSGHAAIEASTVTPVRCQYRDSNRLLKLLARPREAVETGKNQELRVANLLQASPVAWHLLVTVPLLSPRRGDQPYRYSVVHAAFARHLWARPSELPFRGHIAFSFNTAR